MLEFITNHFSDCIFLAVLIVAMIPTIESKIAIPFALSTHIWGEAALSPFMALLISCIGSMLPAIFIIIFARLLKKRTSGFVHDRFVSKIQEKYKSNINKLNGKNSVLTKCLFLATFVALPLPLTGVYTASLIAGLTSLKNWQSFAAIFAGEIFSCLAVLLLCTVFENSIFAILVISLAMVGVCLLIGFAINIFKFSRRTHKM